ncbi:Laminin-like protein epi-1 [Wickerhamomyces ciferrii]|uniref:Laminin-like protein epi-1 n=1 Tax=Wickerhamomyces ciferrii (strain ATCC 14091 / BCRC 22168 / CBS 111 / JCM 3599 / NBRC 0793 / NRRL Y-1031 F-60-10) TaxID=1206466 RepID=K0KSV1_WICCF|nr:Laminin-like protein epi-1 [Wickerhamomyces ciferrii]CCH44454.1 Laminin-like protein epi-1 [Wickerhamomyces ciferrii]
MSIKSSSSSSVVSSMDSVNEELRSLRKSASRPAQTANSTRRGLFDFSRKAFSTNSSPIKASSESQNTKTPSGSSLEIGNRSNISTNADYDDYYGYDENDDQDDDHDDDDFDTKSLGFDPFVENTTDVEIPIANSTTLKSHKYNSKNKQGNYGPLGMNDGLKSVRFKDGDIPNSQPQVSNKPTKSQNQKSISQLQSMFLKSNSGYTKPSSRERLPSSEYSATPDTTEVSEFNDHSNHLTLTQKEFLLPAGLSSEETKKSQSGAKDIKIKFAQGKTNESKNDPKSTYDSSAIVSASTDGGSSLFSKTDTLSAPTDNESAPLKFENVNESSKLTTVVDGPRTGPETFRRINIPETQPEQKLQYTESTPKGKPFSLRLQDADFRRLNSDGSGEESFDHVDILEQSRPALLSNKVQDTTAPIIPEQSPVTSTEKKIILVNPVVHETDVSSHKDAKFSSVIEDEVKHKVHQILKTLSQDKKTFSLDHSVSGESKNLSYYIDQILNFARENDKKLNALKIQLIKLSKQQHDHEDIVNQKDKIVESLNSAISDLNGKLQSIQGKYNSRESAVKSQEKALKLEAQKYSGYDEELATRDSLLEDCRSHIEEKELFIENISRLVSEHSTQSFDLSNEKLAFTQLKSLLKLNHKLKEQEKTYKRAEQLHKKIKRDLDEDLEVLKHKNDELLNGKKILEDQNAKNLKFIEEKELEIENHENTNEKLSMSLKNLELKYTKLQNEIDNEKFRNKEMEAKIQEHENDRVVQDKKVQNMEKILEDQLSLVNEVQQEFDAQTETINNLNHKNKAMEVENEALHTSSRIDQDQKQKLETEAENFKIKLEQKSSQLEEVERRLGNLIRRKDEDIQRLNGRVKTLEQIEANLASELKDTRAKLSAKYTQSSVLEKRCETLSQNLKESGEKNRVIRSEILKHNGHIQELKRTLSGLSYSIIQNLDGIIDGESLSGVRDDLKNDTDDGALEKMHNVSLFIEEAVSLIIKEHWSLSKSLSEARKGSVSNNSLNALQQIIEAKNNRIKLLELRLLSFESAVKKINKTNSRISTRGSSAISNTNNNSRKVNFQPSSSDSDHESIDSNLTVRTHIRSENKEVKKLLNLLKQNSSKSDLSSDN